MCWPDSTVHKSKNKKQQNPKLHNKEKFKNSEMECESSQVMVFGYLLVLYLLLCTYLLPIVNENGTELSGRTANVSNCMASPHGRDETLPSIYICKHHSLYSRWKNIVPQPNKHVTKWKVMLPLWESSGNWVSRGAVYG